MLPFMDHRTDNNPTGINFLLKTLGDRAPGYLNEKKAGEAETHRHFACPMKKTYPYDTPADTWRSYAYLKTANHRLPKDTFEFVERMLKLAAAKHLIEEDICEIDMILSTFEKEAHTDEKRHEFALQVERDGERKNFYPIRTPAQIRKSAYALDRKRDVPLEWRKIASEAIYHAAMKHGMKEQELPASILTYGVVREPNFKIAMEVAEYRGKLLEDKELGELYCDIVKTASHDEEGSLPKYIELMLDLDRATGLDGRYGRGVVDPYQAFLSGPKTEEVEKVASESVVLLDTLVPTEVFQTVKEHVHTVFSKKAADNLRELFEKERDGVALTRAISELPLKTQRELMQIAIEKS